VFYDILLITSTFQ